MEDSSHCIIWAMAFSGLIVIWEESMNENMESKSNFEGSDVVVSNPLTIYLGKLLLPVINIK